MPRAPLIRLKLFILDRPENPYRFESFLNVATEDQLQVLIQPANQEQLFLAFYGDWLNHRFTGVIEQGKQKWQQYHYSPGVGTTPSCCINPHWSQFTQASRIFPSAILNVVVIVQLACLPVAGIPKISP